jgi:putative phosphoribosyl transferase
MRFKDREEAARLLAERLAGYRGQNPLVLGIPRGAVPMARTLADLLDGEMDVVLVHKLRAPDQPELAIGSIDETGRTYLSRYAFGLDEGTVATEKAAQMDVLKKRRALYTPAHPPVDPAGRIVIVVDDGIATGASMIAALRTVRTAGPKKLIAATAVAPHESLRAIEELADEVVCLQVPDDFYAVGEYFVEFDQVSDEEVIALLRQSRSGTKTET